MKVFWYPPWPAEDLTSVVKSFFFQIWKLYVFISRKNIVEICSKKILILLEFSRNKHLHRTIYIYICIYIYIYIYIYMYAHETLVPFEVISSGCNALVAPFQQLLEGPMEVLLCERVNDLRHSLFHLLNCLITTASEIRE